MSLDFAINHMTAPQLGLADFFALARRLGTPRVEIRNDIGGNAILDGTTAATVKRLAAEHEISIVSINALQKFNRYSDSRPGEIEVIADYAAACGAEAVVLVAANDGADPEAASRVENASRLLALTAPVLRDRGLIGLVECLGFETCSLRSKREAAQAIDNVDGRDVFRLTHDTFHHHLAGEPELFPELTGLVHISGVSDPAVAVGDMRDSHRVLVGPGDRLDNIGQIAALRAAGYGGLLSFEPFAAELRQLADPADAVRRSMNFIIDGLAAMAA